jgi:hypothetical protein
MKRGANRSLGKNETAEVTTEGRFASTVESLLGTYEVIHSFKHA